jgi:hypothetical protein
MPSWRQQIRKLWQITFKSEIEEEPLIKSLGFALRKDLHRWQKHLNSTVKELEGRIWAEKVMPGTGRLYGQEFEKGDFRLKFWRTIRQKSILVGRFVNMTGSTVYFDNGDFCLQGNHTRFFKLHMVCGGADEFTQVAESPVCEYSGVFVSPYVCQKGTVFADVLEKLKLKHLKKEAAMRRLDES